MSNHTDESTERSVQIFLTLVRFMSENYGGSPMAEILPSVCMLLGFYIAETAKKDPERLKTGIDLAKRSVEFEANFAFKEARRKP